MRQLILELQPETPPGLDNFVAGSNGEVLTGIAAWLEPGNREPSLFLWGESGAGKTHLLRASGGLYCDGAADPDLSFLGENPEETCPLHAIDNVEALSPAGQIALFNLFNRQRATGKRLLTAASRPPQQLVLREDLRTRLGSGLIYRLQPLTDAEKIDALMAQATARGLRLPQEALDYLLLRAPRDMRSLSALIAALDRYSLEHKRAITLPLLREVLHGPDLNPTP
ncbi:DnaA regulatory inactivator Hda [Propionivibrio limicola]|uniref:DnaA regulatory inactivator Hda n=1 Tax=Propionivibrio limicola TaxID=167645 RepID=UPI0012924629|nr:DnaA regulatory inactivator Hda [Propionivibrio limicola]